MSKTSKTIILLILVLVISFILCCVAIVGGLAIWRSVEDSKLRQFATKFQAELMNDNDAEMKSMLTQDFYEIYKRNDNCLDSYKRSACDFGDIQFNDRKDSNSIACEKKGLTGFDKFPTYTSTTWVYVKNIDGEMKVSGVSGCN